MQEFDLIQKYGSPLYFYDGKILLERIDQIKDFCSKLKNGLPGTRVSMHYSTKANNNPAILKLVRERGLCADCMSLLEMQLNLDAGFSPDKMLYVCNNITGAEMSIVKEKGILICLDSISQVETWGKLFPSTDIMVRINPGIIGVGHSKKVITSGKDTKFGISEDNFDELFAVAKKYDLNIIGTHQHLGSLFLDNKVPNYIAGVKKGLYLVQKYFKDVKIVDLGGGFGVPYRASEKPLNLSYVAAELLPILRNFIKEYPSVQEFKFEPGRFIPCEAGVLLGMVTAVKHENGKYWTGTDIGMNQLVRPSMYKAYHKISLIYCDTKNLGAKVRMNFCGNVCESGDILAKNRILHLPKVGDIAVVHNAGAYGYSMASNYTGRGRPAEVMKYPNGDIKLIRDAETIEDMMAKIVN